MDVYEPTPVVAHSVPISDVDMRPLTEDQVAYLVEARKDLNDAIWYLTAATAGPEILQSITTLLTRANSVVNGSDDWEGHIAASYNTWLGTPMSSGSDEQFQRARNEIAQAATQLAADIGQWIEYNDATTLSTQGLVAMHRLAIAADAAHEYLISGPGSETYTAEHEELAMDEAADDPSYSPAGADEEAAGDEAADDDSDSTEDERWEDDSEELL